MKKSVAFLSLSLLMCSIVPTVFAEDIPSYQAEEVEPYHADEIQSYQAPVVQPRPAEAVQPRQAPTVQPRPAPAVQPRPAEEIQAYKEEIANKIKQHVVVLRVGDQQAVTNGQIKKLDVAPRITHGRTLVPVRFISEMIGADVSWEQKDQLITISLNDTTILLWVNEKMAYVNDTPYELDVAPQVINNRTFVPLRFVSEYLSQDIYFDQPSQQILIYPEGSLDIQPMTASDIELYQAQEVKPYYAEEVKPRYAEEVKPRYAEEVKLRPAAPSIKINLPKSTTSTGSSGSAGNSSGSNGLLFSPADGFRYSDPNGFWGQQWLNPLGW